VELRRRFARLDEGVDADDDRFAAFDGLLRVVGRSAMRACIQPLSIAATLPPIRPLGTRRARASIASLVSVST